MLLVWACVQKRTVPGPGSDLQICDFHAMMAILGRVSFCKSYSSIVLESLRILQFKGTPKVHTISLQISTVWKTRGPKYRRAEQENNNVDDKIDTRKPGNMCESLWHSHNHKPSQPTVHKNSQPLRILFQHARTHTPCLFPRCIPKITNVARLLFFCNRYV